jgi:hypothetical protein
MRFGNLSETEVVTGAATAVTAFVVIKQGLLGKLPAVGPVTQPILAIGIGFAVVAFIDGGGTTGNVVHGLGYGLIAAGAAAL